MLNQGLRAAVQLLANSQFRFHPPGTGWLGAGRLCCLWAVSCSWLLLAAALILVILKLLKILKTPFFLGGCTL